MYGALIDDTGDAQDGDHSEKTTTERGDIEHEIKGELEALQKERSNGSSNNSTPKFGAASASAGRKQLFTHVRLNLQCGKSKMRK